jgi:putative nucleotidyltransferase with HDIG domain
MQPNQQSDIHILAIGSEPDILEQLHNLFSTHGVHGQQCTDPLHALTLLEQCSFPVLLCDMHLPGMGSLGLLEEVRRRFPETAVVVIASSEDTTEAVHAARAGASDYVVRPLRTDTLLVRLHRAAAVRRRERELENHRLNLENIILCRIDELQQGLERVERASEETLRVLGHALGLRDYETAEHCQHVTRYTLELAKALGCSSEEIETFTRAAFLHDFGKIGIPDAILRKPGPLTAVEREIMKTHVRIGYEMVRRISFLAHSAEIVLTHHERFDGAGYPQGLIGHEIPLGARIFAVADTLDAITSRRAYRPARSYAVARKEIARESGHQFDPEVVTAFLSLDEELWQIISDEVKQHRKTSDQYWWIDLHG